MSPEFRNFGTGLRLTETCSFMNQENGQISVFTPE